MLLFVVILPHYIRAMCSMTPSGTKCLYRHCPVGQVRDVKGINNAHMRPKKYKVNVMSSFIAKRIVSFAIRDFS